MDGHGSHETFEFDTACKKLNIISIYMLLHSFHLLQLLDVGFFLLFKRIYTKELENIFRFGINHVNKLEFLEIYKCIQPQIFTSLSILGVFKGVGLCSFNFAVVFNFLNAFTELITSKNELECVQQ